MSDLNFTFTLHDSNFRQWLYEGLEEIGEQNQAGELVVKREAFFNSIADGEFNGAELSLAQRQRLRFLFDRYQDIRFNNFGTVLSGHQSFPADRTARLKPLVDQFYAHCNLDFVTGSSSGWGSIQNYFAERVLDTGTDEEALEALFRGVETPEDMKILKRLIELDFRAQGKPLDDILKTELSSRELGRVQGVIKSVELGSGYFIEKANGKKTPLSKDDLRYTRTRVLKAKADLEEYKQIFSLSDGHVGSAIEGMRDEQDTTHFDKAVALFEARYQLVENNINLGHEPYAPNKKYLQEAAGDVYRELFIFLSQEEEGVLGVREALMAGENVTYMTAGASVAILVGIAALPLELAGGAILLGGGAGTGMATLLRLEGEAVSGRDDKFTDILHSSATDSFSASVGLGIGVGISTGARAVAAREAAKGGTRGVWGERALNVAQSSVARQVAINESIGMSNAVLRADARYGIDDVIILGVSGAAGGVVDDFLRAPMANVCAEAIREGGENLAEAQFGFEGGNVTSSDLIGALGGAMTEMGPGAARNLRFQMPERRGTEVSQTRPEGESNAIEDFDGGNYNITDAVCEEGPQRVPVNYDGVTVYGVDSQSPTIQIDWDQVAEPEVVYSDLNNAINELRDRFMDPPSIVNLGNILNILSDLDESVQEIAIQYAEDHMQEWPKTLRTYSLLHMGGPLGPNLPFLARPEARLFRYISLHYSYRESSLDDASFQQFVELPLLKHIIGLDLSRKIGLFPRRLQMLLDSPHIGGLKSLNISYLISEQEKSGGGFTPINFQPISVASAIVPQLTAAPTMRNLESLNMLQGRARGLSLNEFQQLVTAENLQSLRDLKVEVNVDGYSEVVDGLMKSEEVPSKVKRWLADGIARGWIINDYSSNIRVSGPAGAVQHLEDPNQYTRMLAIILPHMSENLRDELLLDNN